MLSAAELKEQVKAIGADLVGVTGVDTPLLGEHGENPEKLLLDTKSIPSANAELLAGMPHHR